MEGRCVKSATVILWSVAGIFGLVTVIAVILWVNSQVSGIAQAGYAPSIRGACDQVISAESVHELSGFAALREAPARWVALRSAPCR
jgi:hypothetical protein